MYCSAQWCVVRHAQLHAECLLTPVQCLLTPVQCYWLKLLLASTKLIKSKRTLSFSAPQPQIQQGQLLLVCIATEALAEMLQDYAAILARAQEEADIVLWDGGNNDTPFYKPGRSPTQ